MREIAITLDIDWAPDWMIRAVADDLVAAGLKATWFATHRSPETERLLDSDDMFEVGIHPNFLPGSSHGGDARAVAATLRDWFPEARAVRSHCLHQSAPQLQMLVEEFGFDIDCSIFLKDADDVRSHRVRYSPAGPVMVRIPHVFQDNMHMHDGTGWTLGAQGFDGTGLKVLNFHPVHLALNSATPDAYGALKRTIGLAAATPENVGHYVNSGHGAGTLFEELLADLAGARTRTISEIASQAR